MIPIIILWGAALITMLAIDAVWLGTMVGRLYTPNIGHLMAKTPNFYAAGVFYLIYTGALVYLVLYPAITNNWSTGSLILAGAIFGLATYGTFDLTNQAIMKNWPTIITIADMVWGATLTAVVSYLSVRILGFFQ